VSRSDASGPTGGAIGKRAVRWALALAVLIVIGAIALRMALQPERLTRFVLHAVGETLGLEITATGVGEYRLRGSPMLVARDVVARLPGSAVPVLRAQRLLVQVPWTTVRSRGAVLDIERIELDAPVVDVAALQAWLASRPAGDGGIPTLRRGLQVRDGRIDGKGWSVRKFDVDLPVLHAGRHVAARVRGQAVSGPMRGRFDLAVALTQPANGAGFAAFGPADVVRGDTSVPMQVQLAGRALIGSGTLQVAPMRLAVAGTVHGPAMELPFAAALDGPLRLDGSAWTLGPAGLVTRGEGLVPRLDAAGRLRLADGSLGIALRGRIARWPASWPALPPLSQSPNPLGLKVDYHGAPDLSGDARLRLDWDGASADVRLGLFEGLAWTRAAATGTPLPPLAGKARIPVLDVAGATLEGIEIEFEPPAAARGPRP